MGKWSTLGWILFLRPCSTDLLVSHVFLTCPWPPLLYPWLGCVAEAGVVARRVIHCPGQSVEGIFLTSTVMVNLTLVLQSKPLLFTVPHVMKINKRHLVECIPKQRKRKWCKTNCQKNKKKTVKRELIVVKSWSFPIEATDPVHILNRPVTQIFIGTFPKTMSTESSLTFQWSCQPL